MTTAFAPRPRVWARADYERLVSAGILGPGDRVELLEGEIIEMSPEKSRHAAAVDLALDALRRRKISLSAAANDLNRLLDYAPGSQIEHLRFLITYARRRQPRIRARELLPHLQAQRRGPGPLRDAP